MASNIDKSNKIQAANIMMAAVMENEKCRWKNYNHQSVNINALRNAIQ